MTAFKDHFSTVADDYARYRPTYSPALAARLAEVCRRHRCAFDVGCGTGQLSVLLAYHFDLVRATDASERQIAAAKRHAQVVYACETAEQIGAHDGSADLIVAAQAAHWFDRPRFYAECRRIGSQGAVIALVTYGIPRLDGAPGRVVADYHGRDLKPYWPAERCDVVSGYRDFGFPFAEIGVSTPAIIRNWRLQDLLGYLRTWSAVRQAEASGAIDMITTAERRLTAAWGEASERRTVTWPVSMRVGRL